MEDYARISLETHLFFARIMKEHSFFLEAGFLKKDAAWAQRAEFFRRQFEELLRQTVRLLNGLIRFKENTLQEVKRCRLFTANYPLLIEHIMREAKLYRETVNELMQGKDMNFRNLQKTEAFWNQIMMEHAMFIRGLLDSSEEELIETADKFAVDFKELLEKAKKQECRAGKDMSQQSLEETKKIKEFKTAGTRGLLDCKIESIMVPLLADHVLREANHYIRILECGYDWREI